MGREKRKESEEKKEGQETRRGAARQQLVIFLSGLALSLSLSLIGHVKQAEWPVTRQLTLLNSSEGS